MTLAEAWTATFETTNPTGAFREIGKWFGHSCTVPTIRILLVAGIARKKGQVLIDKIENV